MSSKHLMRPCLASSQGKKFVGSRQRGNLLDNGPVPVKVLRSRYEGDSLREMKKNIFTRDGEKAGERKVVDMSEAVKIQDAPRSNTGGGHQFLNHFRHSDDGLMQTSSPQRGKELGDVNYFTPCDPSSAFELGCFSPSTPPAHTERWAGPAYSNSPPPSTLPFPKFPIHRIRSVVTEVTVVTQDARRFHDAESLLNSSVPSSPSRGAYGFYPITSYADNSSATKDLRRLLNLDTAGNLVDDDGRFSLREDFLKDTATQGLKRILQLG